MRLLVARRNNPIVVLVVLLVATVARAFSPPVISSTRTSLRSPTNNSRQGRIDRFIPRATSQNNNEQIQNNDSIWLPRLRRVMGGVATAGALETAYLTYFKLTNQVTALCGVDGSCQSVLSGPYSKVPFTEIPLSVMGFVAYVTMAVLALQPILATQEDEEVDDTWNRVALTTVSTGMATFSVFLMTLLFGVLQTTCPYCVFSAACSIILAKLAWIGGAFPEGDASVRRPAAQAISTSFVAATITAVALFVSVDDPIVSGNNLSSTSTWLASAGDASTAGKLYSPPSISTKSSSQAMDLARKLESMDAKMYGAYWCSHCFDQKETLGKEAFSKITYVECSKDGINSQTKLCKEKEVPGYPTWEINGKLYPGEQALDELEDLVKSIASGAVAATKTN